MLIKSPENDFTKNMNGKKFLKFPHCAKADWILRYAIELNVGEMASPWTHVGYVSVLPIQIEKTLPSFLEKSFKF